MKILERRANSKTIEKAIEIWDIYSPKLNEVVDSVQREILKALNISNEKWENSNVFYVLQNDQQINMIHFSLQQQIKL